MGDLGDRLAVLQLSRIVAARPPRIAVLDVERVPGQARAKHRGLGVEGDFWDLSDWKHTIGRRIRPDEVLAWPRTICAAWRWYGAKRVEFAAEWEDGREAFLRRAWEVYHQADIMVGHNLAGFDTKKLRSEWMLVGLTAPSPFKTVDTLKVARSIPGFESNALASLTERLGIPTKVDRYDPTVAARAVAGDVACQRRLTRYNKGDIAATEALYDALRPWMTNHPPIGLYSGDEDACPNCGSLDVEQSGWAHTALTQYAQYHCTNCGAWLRANHVKRRVTRRAAR